MPDIFPLVLEDTLASYNERRELLDKADEAKASGDRDQCIDLIKRVFDAFDLKSSRLAQPAAAIIIGLGSPGIDDSSAAFLT